MYSWTTQTILLSYPDFDLWTYSLSNIKWILGEREWERQEISDPIQGSLLNSVSLYRSLLFKVTFNRKRSHCSSFIPTVFLSQVIYKQLNVVLLLIKKGASGTFSSEVGFTLKTLRLLGVERQRISERYRSIRWGLRSVPVGIMPGTYGKLSIRQ